MFTKVYHEKKIYKFTYKVYRSEIYDAHSTRSAYITATSMVEAVDKFNSAFRSYPDIVDITEIPVLPTSANQILE